ncbi:MAG: transposase [Desulfovibrio sp.]|nr:transposase [Desulfovibrio sp.]
MTGNWIIEYNAQRPHESLGNLTLGEFALKHSKMSSFKLH